MHTVINKVKLYALWKTPRIKYAQCFLTSCGWWSSGSRTCHPKRSKGPGRGSSLHIPHRTHHICVMPGESLPLLNSHKAVAVEIRAHTLDVYDNWSFVLAFLFSFIYFANSTVISSVSACGDYKMNLYLDLWTQTNHSHWLKLREVFCFFLVLRQIFWG